MSNPQHRRPLVLGIFGASLAPVVFLMFRESQWPKPPDFDLTVLKVWYLSSLAGALCLGVPIAFLLKRASKLTWHSVLLASVVAGNLFTQLVTYAFLGEFRTDRLLDLHVLLEASCLGLAAGLGFCVASWPNPSVNRTA